MPIRSRAAPSISTVPARRQFPPFNFDNLTSSSSGARTLASGTVGIAGTFTPGSNSYTTNGNTIDFNGTTQTIPAFSFHNLMVSGSGTKTLGGNISVGGALTLSAGTLADGGFTATVNGDLSNSATHSGAGKILLSSGSTSHTLSGAGTFQNLELNDANGASLNLTNLTVNGALTLTAGKITTTTNKVIINTNATVARTSGYVIGNLQKHVVAGANVSHTFDVGTTSGYNPVSVTFSNVTTAGKLIAVANASDHASIGSSTISSATSANVNWTLSKDSSLAFNFYNATFQFNNPGDLDAFAQPTNFTVGKFASSAWTYPMLGTRTTTNAQALAISSLGDFQLGNNTPVSSALAMQTQPSAVATAGVVFAQQPVVRVLDQYGNLMTNDNNTVVTATRSGGSGTLQGTLTATAVNGIATFANLSHRVATTITINFTSGSLTNVVSDNIVVSPAAAARIEMQTEPSSTATAGVAFAQQPVLAVEDQFGNTVASDNNTTVTATRNAGTGTLQGTTTVTAANGLAAFTNLSHQVAGNITIDFNGGNFATVTSSSISIAGAAAAGLEFSQQPTSTIAGKVFSTQPIVRAVDAFGNAGMLPANLDVTISLSSGTGLLFGQKVFDIGTAAGNGTVTFTNLEINAAGDKQLIASAGGLTSAVSGTFTNVGTVQRYFLVSDYSVGSVPGKISLGNLRGKGTSRDLVTANYSDDTVSVRLCNDAGGFQVEKTFYAGLHPSSLLTADLNRDNFDDIAVGNYGTNTIRVLLNLMRGGYTPAKAFTNGATANPGPVSMTAADVNRDGRIDIVVGNEIEKSVSVLLGLGGGNFSAPANYSIGASVGSVAVLDLDNDHLADLLVANPAEGTATYLLGLANGTFGAPHTLSLFPSGNPQPKVIFAADFDRDGRQDLVTANYASNSVSIFLNQGNLTFSHNADYEVGTKPRTMLVRDLDVDGRHDLAVVNSGSGTVDILISRGDGTFFPGGTVPVGANPNAIAGSNFNDDNATDLAVVNTDANTVSALLYSAPIAVAQDVNVQEDVAKAITLTHRALIPVSVEYSVVDQPTNGTLSGTAPNLVYTPAADAVGSDQFTFKVSSGTITSAVAQVHLTILPIPDAPSFDLSTNQIFVLEDSGPQTMPNVATNISKGPSDESAQALTFSITTADPKFFSVAPKLGTNGALTFRTATNVCGTNVLTIVLRDSGNTSNGGANQSPSQTLALIVTPVNDSPIFKIISPKSLPEDTSTNFAFFISDPDNAASDLTITATSSNPSLVSNDHLLVNRSGTNWSLSIMPETNAFGSAVITLFADDGANLISNKFNLTVLSVNDAPSFSIPVRTVTVTEDAPLQTVPNFISEISTGPANELSQAVSFVVAVTNSAFFLTQPAINSSGTLTFRPALNIKGTNFFTVRIKDNGGTANGGTNQSPAQSFRIVVLPDLVKLINGSYNGLFFESAAVNHNSSGSIGFTIGSQRVFSGKLLIEGGTYSFSGQFDTNGAAAIQIPRTGKTTLAASMQLDLVNQIGEVSGTITDGHWMADLSGGRAATNLVNLSAGKYSVAFVANSDGVSAPGGDSLGVVTLSANGTLSFSGTLSDNTAVLQSTRICSDGQWPLYLSLYGGRGSLLAWITLTNQPSNKFTGDVSWIKTNLYGAFYTHGFTNEMAVIGSALSLTTAPLLNLSNGIVVLSDANLPAPQTNTFSFSTNSVVSITSTNNRLSLTLNKSTGLLTGSFIHPTTKRTTSIKGVLMQDENTARGFFYTTDQSGAFWLGTE